MNKTLTKKNFDLVALHKTLGFRQESKELQTHEPTRPAGHMSSGELWCSLLSSQLLLQEIRCLLFYFKILEIPRWLPGPLAFLDQTVNHRDLFWAQQLLEFYF